jgi:hypothetical protein
MTEISAIVAAASDAFTALGVLPYVLAGAVIALVGRFILAAKKAGR